MFCTKCGTQIPENEQDCPNCKKTDKTEQTMEQQVESIKLPEQPELPQQPDMSPQPVDSTNQGQPAGYTAPNPQPAYTNPNPQAPSPAQNFQMPGNASEAMGMVKSTPLYIALAGCAAMLISLFLPFATVTFFGKYSISYISGDGKIALILIVAVAVLLWFKKTKIAIIPLVLAVLMSFYTAANILGVGSISLSIGFFLYLIGAAVAGAGIFQIIKKTV